ncbi:sugar phosphate nucleotidyltransferase [Corynebacterium curieae]|uniref:sugar phosphate nucleotidyltransferase n=1 Tax=Corynebacterium curieae TaxID=2913500 RepID=UPI003B8A81F8
MTSPSKQVVLRHFDEYSLAELLRARGKDEQAAKVQRAAEIIHPVAVIQDEPLGLEHAVGLAEAALDADEDYFAVILPDDVIEPTVAMSEMIRVRQEHGGSVLLAVEMEPSQVSNYGVFDVEATEADRVKKVVGMVEKTAVEDAQSNLVDTGRCLLDRATFGAPRRITAGKGGELQLSDAIALLISETPRLRRGPCWYPPCPR